MSLRSRLSIAPEGRWPAAGWGVRHTLPATACAGLGVLGAAYGLPTACVVLGIGSGISLLVVLTLWGRLPRASSA